VRRVPTAALIGALLALLTLARLPSAWASGNALNHVSGAWMALADDLAHGLLYRPVRDPALGFGGTRFFPLTFALEAVLFRAGLPLVVAGQLLALAAGLSAALGAAHFLRRAGHTLPAAAGLGALPLAGFAGQLGLASARGDLPAAALSIWGLSCLLPDPRRPGARTVGKGGIAAVLFVLAFLAKPTALAAAAAGTAFLWRSGERGPAVRLTMRVAVGCALALAAVDVLSAGRFHELLGGLGTGGAHLAGLVHAPLRLAEVMVREDPAGLVLLAAAGSALLGRHPSAAARSPALLLASLWLASSLATVLAVLASPGTGVNHLLELEAAAALLAGSALSPPRTRLAGPGGLSRLVSAAAALAAAVSLFTSAAAWRRDRAGSRIAEAREALDAAREGAPAPLLSEDPLVPLLGGERPFALDAWMLRIEADRDPTVAAALVERLRSGGFRAVVLLRAVDAPDAEEWFSHELGSAALAEIRQRWRPALAVGPYHVYRFAEAGPPSERLP